MEITKMDTTNTQHQKTHRPHIKSIVEQHVEESAFCWLRRKDALWHPAFNLNQFNRCNQRLDAHLEGLRLGADAAWPYALKRMTQWKTADEVFAASYIAIQECREDQLNAITQIAKTNSDVIAGIAAALQWTLLINGKEKALPAIQFFWQQQDVIKSAVVNTALQIPEINISAILEKAIHSADATLREKALDAIGNYHLNNYRSALYDALNDQEPLCRLAASTSLAIMGKPQHLQKTTKFISLLNGNHQLKKLMIFSYTSLEDDFNKWISNANEKISLRDLIWIDEFRGDSNSLNRLTSRLDHKDATTLATYAIQHITGLDLDSLDDSQKHQSDILEDERNLAAPIKQLRRESEGLSSAASEFTKEWLSSHWDMFDNGDRFLNGRSIQDSSLQLNALCSMPQHWHQSLMKTLTNQSLDFGKFPISLFAL